MTKNEKSKPDDSQLYDLIIQTISDNIKVLAHDKVHEAKVLIGTSLWSTFDNEMRRYTGGVVYKLVDRRLLPLIYKGKTSSNKHTYWIA